LFLVVPQRYAKDWDVKILLNPFWFGVAMVMGSPQPSAGTSLWQPFPALLQTGLHPCGSITTFAGD